MREREREGQMETEREKEMNEPRAFRKDGDIARRNALTHSQLSATNASKASECARLGKEAHQVLVLIPKGGTGYAEQQRAVKAHFNTVNQLVTDVREFIKQAVGKVDTNDKSLVSMRLHLQTIQKHMNMLNNLSNK